MNGKNSLFYKCLDGGAALLLVLAMVVPFLPARMDTAAAVSTTVVISQVYGGGGNAGATYRNDFIELYNLGTATVDLSGWSVQYGSATGSTWAATPLSGSIAPGHYYLVKEAAGAGGTVDLPTPDDTGTLALAATNGKVALVQGTTALSGACPKASTVDFVGFGATANCYEGAGATATLTNTTAALRANSGAQDTDNNAADFSAAAPLPRNSRISALEPGVLFTTPADGKINQPQATALQITFSANVTLAEPWFEFTCDGAPITANVTGTGAAYTVQPASPLPLGASCTFKVLKDQVTDANNHPMSADYLTGFWVTGACGKDYTAINAIEGSGDTSPLNGLPEIVEGIVTLKETGASGMQGFYLQSLASADDNNPATSEGLFVSSTAAVSVGDYVRLKGMVDEFTGSYYGEVASMTGLTGVDGMETCATGEALPAPVTVTLPDDAPLERFEGMRVHLSGPLTVEQNYFQGRFGQVTLGAGGRLFQPLNGTGSGAGNLNRMIVLDDDTFAQNLNPIPYYAADGALRTGDLLDNLTGVLDQGRINTDRGSSGASLTFPNVYYRLQPEQAPTVTSANPRLADPPSVGGTLKVASFNVLNYFTTLDKSPYSPPYSSGNTPRGANTPEELTRQQNKITAAMAKINADVFGLMEIESYDAANAPTTLAQALNTQLTGSAAAPYAAVADPATGTGGDVIQTALIYNTLTVEPDGPSLSATDPIFDRFPFAQVFKSKANGEKFVVVVNHFKSKGSCPAPTDANYAGNFDTGSGQGCWNAKRVAQADALITFINNTLKPLDQDVLVIGDLNAYGQEDPIQALTGGGLINQVEQRVDASSRYSYVFDGQSGYLDHALSTPSFNRQISGVSYWHINADEPSIIDYNTEYKAFPPAVTGSPDLYTPAPYRASDHDPVMVGLNLTANQPPQVDNPLTAQRGDVGKPFTFQVPANTFSDPDANDTLTYTAALVDGSPLPAWLTFDPATRSFSGMPGLFDANNLIIKVTVTDLSNVIAGTSFDLTIWAHLSLPVIGGLPQ